MSLADISRPALQVRYDPWDQDVTVVPLSALQLVELNERHAGISDSEVKTSTKEMMEFYSDLMSLCVTIPAATKEEWLSDASYHDVIDLGELVAKAVGIIPDTDSAKN